MLAHVNVVREYLILLTVYYWECMYRNEDLVSFTVDANAIIIVLVLIIRCELHIYVLRYTSWNHSLLVVLDLEVVGLRWQYVQSLWGRRVVDQSHFQRVSLQDFEA